MHNKRRFGGGSQASFFFFPSGYIMEFTTPSLIWFLAGIVLFLLEMALPGFILFFFGLGAWLTAAVSWFFPLSLNGQILVFIIASLISLLCLRSFVKSAFFGRAIPGEGDSALATPGAQAVVVAAIVPPAEGKVKYSGTSWRAIADERIEAGEITKIVSQDGLIMKVKRVDSGEV